MSERYRIEHDSQGELRIPAKALYGAQTQRAVENFRISELRMPGSFIRALCRIKSAAARVNADLGMLDSAVAVAMSGHLKTLAVSLMKISNDLRWMNSGPLAGLGEITLPVLKPGSSIMPGKVNPVIPEAVAMVCARVIGNDMAITVAGQSGNFQLNAMLPLVAHDLLQSINLLAGAVRALDEKVISGFSVNHKQLAQALANNPVLVTALNPVVGYEQSAAIAKRAWAEGRPVLDVAEEMTDISRAELVLLLDPARLAGKQGK